MDNKDEITYKEYKEFENFEFGELSHETQLKIREKYKLILKEAPEKLLQKYETLQQEKEEVRKIYEQKILDILQ